MKTRLGSILMLIGFGLGVGLQAQTPTPVITGTLGSSLPTSQTANLPNAITVNTFLPNGFELYIPGNFNPNLVYGVQWTNTVTGFESFLGSFNFRSVSNNLIVVNIPGNTPGFISGFTVTAPQRVDISVLEFIPQSESTRSSNTAPFFINPRPNSVFLTDSLTAGIPFNAPLVSGGTPPYSAQVSFGSPPPGLNLIGSSIGGTPTTPGLYDFSVDLTDAWGNFAFSGGFLQVVGVPTITSISPPGVLAGSPTIQISIAGTNFVQPVESSGESFRSEGQIRPLQSSTIFPGTIVQWTVGSTVIDLETTVVNANLLIATIPAALLAAPGTALITVVQPSGAASAPVQFVISGKLTITSATLPAGAQGVAYTANVLASGGLQPFVWSAQGLPAGLSINPANGAIFGTPTAFGTSLVSFTVRDAFNQIATAQISLLVNPPPLSIATQSIPNGAATVAYSAQITATGGVPALTWVAQGLPAGLTINPSTGLISGTPTVFGSFPVTVRVNDTASQNASRQYALVIAPPPLSITTAALSSGTQGVAYSFALQSSGGVAPLTWNATGLPAGLSINQANGIISGTPTSFGTSNVNITLADSAAQTTNRQLSLVIAPRPVVITTTVLPPGQQTIAYNATLIASGGVLPFTWSATGLPAGITINTATGALTGTPTANGSFSPQFTVRDSAQQTAIATIPISIGTPPPPPVEITGPTTLPAGTVGVSYSYAFTVTGGTPGYTVNLDGGSLPGGLSIANSVLSGTPTIHGTFRFSVRATDSTGATGFKDYTLVINPAPLNVTGTVKDVPRDSAVSVTFGATGGVPPYSFGATGSIPIGTVFTNGVLSGTATTIGTYTFAVTATDSLKTTSSRSFTINVTAPLPTIVITGTAGNGVVGTAYTATFAASGGVAPYTLSATGLPPGLTFGGNSITGTPTADGPFAIIITATDSTGAKGTQTFNVTITPVPLVITTTSLPAASIGVAYTATLQATGGTPPLTWSVTGLPSTLSANAAGNISGTPDAAATFTVTATVTDSKGASQNRTFTLTVAPPPLTIVTSSVPSGVVGTAISQTTFAASGGVPPYTWSSAGLPGGLALSTAGVLSGTPTTAGTTSFSVAVQDSTGLSVNRPFSFTAVLPTPPTLNLAGLPATSNPSTQPRLTIALASAFPLPVTVTLTMTFAADSGPDDPTVRFENNTRSATLVIPAGSTSAPTDLGVQVGTVAGTATITARLTAGGQDLTPTPAPTRTVRVNPGPPVITAVTATRNATGFTVVITGFASTRSVSTANFTFTPAAGATLQTTQLSVPVDAIFAPFFSSATGAATGSQFTFTQPFTVSGSAQIASLSVTLVNAAGTSNSVTATLQ